MHLCLLILDKIIFLITMIESNLRNVKILSEQDKKEWEIINQIKLITDCYSIDLSDCI